MKSQIITLQIQSKNFRGRLIISVFRPHDSVSVWVKLNRFIENIIVIMDALWTKVNSTYLDSRPVGVKWWRPKSGNDHKTAKIIRVKVVFLKFNFGYLPDHALKRLSYSQCGVWRKKIEVSLLAFPTLWERPVPSSSTVGHEDSVSEAGEFNVYT